MATLVSGNFPNITDWAKRQSPMGGIADITNVLTKKKPELDDIPFVEGNLPTGHKLTLVDTALPSGTFRKINAGIAPTKGATNQYEETCCMLDDECLVDKALAKLNGDAAAFRASEEAIKVEGLSQQAATAVWYESAITNPERMHGLSPRYGGTSGFVASSYVKVKGTVSGTNAQSVWCVTWEPRKLYGIVPKGSYLGLERNDKGEVRVIDPNDSTKALWMYDTYFSWKFGIAVEDYRYAVRSQWDPDDSTNFADTGKTMYQLILEQLNTIYDVTPNTRIYMSRTSKAKLDAQIAANNLNVFDSITIGGRKLQTIGGVPIRVTDSLVGETAIS